MIPVEHASNNDVLQPPRGTTPDQVQPLPITRVRFADDTPAVWSYWQPSDDERRAIATGAAVRLSIVGFTHPPLHIGVDEEHQAEEASAPSVEHVMQLVAEYRAVRSESPTHEQEAYRAVLEGVSLLFARGVTHSTPAARDVLAERQRQVTAEGWTTEHDDDHDEGSLAAASSGYALAAADELNPLSQGDGRYGVLKPPPMWPQDWIFKADTPRRMLVKASALALAEIERLDRAATKSEAA